MVINYMRQRSDDDCGITAIAMATGSDYDAVRAEIGRNSINQTDFEEWCRSHGYAWQIVYQNHVGPDRRFHKREEWPPRPFAPVHVCQVKATRDLHFTVMDGDGVVFDPWSEERKSLTHPDYRELHWVMGLFKLPLL